MAANCTTDDLTCIVARALLTAVSPAPFRMASVVSSPFSLAFSRCMSPESLCAEPVPAPAAALSDGQLRF